MSPTTGTTATLPRLPASHQDLLNYIKSNPEAPIQGLIQPYNEYDAVLRQIFAQTPSDPILADNHVNIVPLYDAAGSADLRVRARDVQLEPNELKEKYVMPLKDEDRRPNGSHAIVPTLTAFKENFSIFSEASLSDLDWSNVVAAGSAVITSLLPVPDKHCDSKRALRKFYHDQFAPASDVDLFIYGLSEEQAIEKITQIEKKIKDSILHETTAVRTKNTITIVSQYPTRHVQIVLRIYKSIAEILTGFDVDCACVAYDGQNVYAAPRAIAAYITQANQIDLTRRSPSYENRLSKYSHRGFEVFWPQLDRSRIDPTIFERSFTRTVGLARLLVLEKLPKASDRDDYLQQRRRERGRPALNTIRWRSKFRGNIKDVWEDEVAEWVKEEDVSDYHTFTIPYGEKFNARKIERLLYTKDLLLNSEWNNKDREVNLHRHPAFVGSAEDVIHDCCGFCPQPLTTEELEVWEEESKTYISGSVSFLKDDPGRQEIGSFNPTTETDWTEMAYVGNTPRFFEAIAEDDLEAVDAWLSQKGADPNRRDYTGRTPLHFAVMTSTPEIVQCLVDHEARLISRIADGRTALHLAAARGSLEIVKILLTKSEANEAVEEDKKDRLRRKPEDKDTRTAGNADDNEENSGDDDIDEISITSGTMGIRTSTVGSLVHIKGNEEKAEKEQYVEDNTDEPDVYDINVLAWDTNASPLHLAIVHGHIDVVEELVSSFGADVLLPVKLFDEWKGPKGAILPLVLALSLSPDRAIPMVETLLRLGVTSAQADITGKTSAHYFAMSLQQQLFDVFMKYDEPAFKRAINHLAVDGPFYSMEVESGISVALKAKNQFGVTKLLEVVGATTNFDYSAFLKGAKRKWGEYFTNRDSDANLRHFNQNIDQPIMMAVLLDQPLAALALLKHGADPNTLTRDGHQKLDDSRYYNRCVGNSVLDVVVTKIRQLGDYTGEKPSGEPPSPLKDDAFYLEPYEDGSYQMFFARMELREAKNSFSIREILFKEEEKKARECDGLDEKKSAISALRCDFQTLETALLEKGAKTFKELYPGRPEGDQQDMMTRGLFGTFNPMTLNARGGTEFEVKLQFQTPDLTGAKRDGYLKLFEAAWSGDIDTIKSLTQAMWGQNNKEPPLEIAVTDSRSFSPFSLAVLRGHLDVAKAIIEIARVQYKPPGAESRKKYEIQADDSEYSDSDDSRDGDEIQVRGQVVRDEFTIDDIGDIATTVESSVKPLSIMRQPCQVFLFVDTKNCLDEPSRRPHFMNSLLNLAIYNDDIDLLIFLLELEQSVSKIGVDDENDSSRLAAVPSTSFKAAIFLGRLRCLAELIRRTGTGLPLDAVVEESGIEVKEKPKCYQGLSVHGKKRADWVAAARGDARGLHPENVDPPLKVAALSGNLESVEWFLSTAPGRHYVDFAEAHREEASLKALAQTEKGIEGSIMNWLNTNRDLVLHDAIIGGRRDGNVDLIKYLVKNVPECIEAKSPDGYTPLAIAFSGLHASAAKILIEAGADQTVRDRKGNNLIHLILCDAPGNPRPTGHIRELAQIKELLGLLDQRLVPSLLIERSSEDPGSLTPFARWMHRVNPTPPRPHLTRSTEPEAMVELARIILDFAESTGQKHLELLDGAGNTPIHDVINHKLPKILEMMLDRRPDLLDRENAVGWTPTEVAMDKYQSQATAQAPPIPTFHIQNLYSHEPLSAWPKNDFLLRKPELFLPDRQNDSENVRREIYNLCLQKAVKGAGKKRKLVSLFEANEVAKRLASRKKRNERVVMDPLFLGNGTRERVFG